MSVYTKKYPDNLIFSMEITNGYVFRQIFELYDKLVISNIPMFFKKSGVTIRACILSTRDNRKLISDIEIFTDDIIEYYINTSLTTIKDQDSENPCQIEKISMNTVKSVLKSISKSNSIRLYKTLDCDDICIQIKGVNIENAKITSGRYQNADYDISNFNDISEIPNIKVDIGQFCATMKGIVRDTDFTIFKVFPSGLIIEGRNTISSVVKNNKWGIADEGEDFYECRVGTNFIKALCKINGMANYSIIKFFCNKNGCFKLNHKIGDFGEHNIYISENQ
jgi:hypothetical protein